jgi:hypothetical protein
MVCSVGRSTTAFFVRFGEEKIEERDVFFLFSLRLRGCLGVLVLG